MWFGAKYANPLALKKYIALRREIWKNHPFLSRQVTAVIPRIYPHSPEFSVQFLVNQINSGLPDSSSVASHILHLLRLKGKSNKKLTPYIFTKTPQTPYPLPKFLILYSFLNSFNLKMDVGTINKVKRYIDDPWYLKWCKEYFAGF